MNTSLIAEKTLAKWLTEYPLLSEIKKYRELFWLNPQYDSHDSYKKFGDLSSLKEAEERLLRFAPFLASVFPETRKHGGLIESPITPIPHMQERLERLYKRKLSGRLCLKCDSHLPIAGSVKARGGIYEVLKHAETLALENSLIKKTSDYSLLQEQKDFFHQYSLAVGSTGNLGLSIGIVGAAFGFRVIVHMSIDAKQWKKDLLRSKGVNVIEHAADYSKAVEIGRAESSKDPFTYFIDDENSWDLLYGYAVAASRLDSQLEAMDIAVDENHPLFVYLPCGVGGAPGGITYGLKAKYHENVHCFFAEPTHAPCMLLGLMTNLHDGISVQKFGLDNITAADGLAVGRPSGLVGKTLQSSISGIYTVDDKNLYSLLSELYDTEAISLEPSALAGMPGPFQLQIHGHDYLHKHGLVGKLTNATHIVWATGGSLVPESEMQTYYKIGKHSLQL